MCRQRVRTGIVCIQSVVQSVHAVCGTVCGTACAYRQSVPTVCVQCVVQRVRTGRVYLQYAYSVWYSVCVQAECTYSMRTVCGTMGCTEYV